VIKKHATRGFGVFILTVAAAIPASAGSIEGTIVIKKRLTKPRVTAQVPAYQRGPAVDLIRDEEESPLAFERSRVAVYLEGQFSQQAPVAPVTLKMEQSNRRFTPELLVIQAGSRVSFPNQDPIFHNVFSLSGPASFDLGNYPMGDSRIVAFPRPGIVYVNCHLHSNMTATIVVTPNRWNAQAGRDGNFELQDIPPGTYTVVAWHKAGGFFRQTVAIEADKPAHIEFLIPVDENGHKLASTKHY
jgi:plastocyanin